MKYIDKQVKLLRKDTKGEITVPSIIKFLECRGYSVVFFNTEEGDALLYTYGIKPHETKAFTYCNSTNTVFVDNNLHMSDKLYSLLHECAHILLGHIGNDQIHLVDKRKIENEAEAFAYKVLNYSPPKTLRNTVLSMLAASLITTGTFFCTLLYISGTSDLYMPATASSSIAAHQSASDEPISPTVYVTPSGKKYHRAICRYVKSKDVAALHKAEAEKTHDPCSICKP